MGIKVIQNKHGVTMEHSGNSVRVRTQLLDPGP
jgi:hypothetical protein